MDKGGLQGKIVKIVRPDPKRQRLVAEGKLISQIGVPDTKFLYEHELRSRVTIFKRIRELREFQLGVYQEPEQRA